VRYLESHENEFEWFPHSYNALMLMPWRDGQPPKTRVVSQFEYF